MRDMKHVVVSSLAAAFFHTEVLAGWLNFGTRGYPSKPADGQGCPFTLSSTGSFACPAGQLPDGQIRLNGSYDTATFYINSNGGIVDSKGFGCVVTAAPVTQVQCDQGATPDIGFFIDSSDTLMYHGSPGFYACPATDTEYNIYVNPNFGQAKCFPITLKASGRCGASSCLPAVASTVWQTQTVNENSTTTVTVTTTSACPVMTSSTPPYASSNSTVVCHHCTKTANGGWH